jgi:penicillin-binding protein 2
MRLPHQTHDWSEVADEIGAKPQLRDPWPGIRGLWWCFVLGLVLIFGRRVWIEWADGAAYRTLAARPIERHIRLPAQRGRILARDGQVLAEDESVACVGVQYRWLEEPVDASWLRRTARNRLSAAERQVPARVRQAEQQILEQRALIQAEVARLCEITPHEWQRRRAEVQRQVTTIRDSVNRARLARWQAARRAAAREMRSTWHNWYERARYILLPDATQPPPEPITIAEELDFQVMAEGLAPETARRVAALGEQLPAVRVVTRQRRRYPQGASAAHVVGYLGPLEEHSTKSTREHRGKTGLERAFQETLQGTAGTRIEHLRRNGQLLVAFDAVEATHGRDVRTTLDLQLQQSAELLLADALARRAAQTGDAIPAGGAIVALDCSTGAVLAAASLPGFDPNWFERRDAARVSALLHDAAHPLLDRTTQMQIPPGSVFKVLTALALLEATPTDIQDSYVCRGYLQNPDQQRCAIFTRYGTGHGPVGLHEALVQSCNCYFFHHAGWLGAETLLRYATHFGFGTPSGIELLGEAAGHLPELAEVQQRAWRVGDTQALAIGQGPITVTPIQVARMMACIANGGALVRPHLVASERDAPRSHDLLATLMSDESLQAVRRALCDVVECERGTAYTTGGPSRPSMAGKTGTAESSGGLPDHAWFAGYAPAEVPEVAFVVALEHGGEAAQTAVPLARRLLEHMERLGYFSTAATPRVTWNRRAASEGDAAPAEAAPGLQ